jgi:hypothetical protein
MGGKRSCIWHMQAIAYTQGKYQNDVPRGDRFVGLFRCCVTGRGIVFTEVVQKSR